MALPRPPARSGGGWEKSVATEDWLAFGGIVLLMLGVGLRYGIADALITVGAVLLLLGVLILFLPRKS